MDCGSNISAFGAEGYPKEWFLSFLTQSTDEIGMAGSLGVPENQRADQLVARQSLQYHRETPEGARCHKPGEKNLANLCGENHKTRPVRTYTHNKFERPPESLARLIGEGFPLYEASL